MLQSLSPDLVENKKVIARNPNKPWITQGILFSIKKETSLL